MIHFKDNIKTLFWALVFTSIAFPVWSQSNPALNIVRDTEIESVIKEWASPVFEAAGLDPKAVNIILVQNSQLNAFVAGGSNIFIYTGLIEKTENPGELIGVIAHETGHISGGHLIKTRDALERASYESILGTILGLGAAIATGETGAVGAISAGSTSVAQRRFLTHSRVQESSADQAALSFMDKAQLNPSGLSSFMNKLKAEIYRPFDQQSEYVLTHPLVENRISAIQERMEQSPYKDKDFPSSWVKQHALIKAKLIGYITPEQVDWTYNVTDKSTEALYARTIAAYRNNKVEDAITLADELLAAEPQNPYFLEQKGQILFDFGRGEESIAYFNKAIELLPDAPFIRIALAHAMIESGDDPALLKEAIKHLEIALQDEPRASRIHRLLATAYGRLGKDNMTKLHLAEEAVLQRRFDYAKVQVNTILQSETENSPLTTRANDILVFIEKQGS
ncbi:MAG: M48 family metalloprotease [Alphaproteobacteria bacterium]|nr:M48 family metalloprotease [Alphaproteobacteria bacterium]